jgi:hypothetical protein
MSVFEKESAHALVVGIARYRNIRQLPEVKDATEIAALLADEKRGGYPDKNVRLLRDEEATLTAIRRELGELAGRARPESAVFIYFSGHGGAVASGPRAGQYLLPVDVAYPDDDALAATAIREQEFTEALRAIPAQKVLIVLDCCHASGIGQPRILSAAGQDLPQPLSDYDVLRGGEGRVILASSRADELSWVPAGSEYGLFTKHLLAGLNGGAASEDGFVRVFDLFEYLQPKVTAERRDQRPYFKGELGSNFPVALSQGGRACPAPRTDDGFRYDVYVSYVDRSPDGDWVWDTLLPRLRGAGLRVAVSEDVLEPGVARVVGVERAIVESRRTLLVLSEQSLRDKNVHFENVLAQTVGVKGGTYPLIPVLREPVPDDKIPIRLSQLAPIDLTHPNPARAEMQFARLIKALGSELPKWGG